MCILWGPGETLEGPWGILGDPEGTLRDPGGSCGLLWGAFKILLKNRRRFPIKCCGTTAPAHRNLPPRAQISAPAAPAEMGVGSAVRDRPSTRAGGQDDVSSQANSFKLHRLCIPCAELKFQPLVTKDRSCTFW